MLNGRQIVLGPLLAGDSQALFHWVNDSEILASNGMVRPSDGAGFNAWFANLGKDASRIYFAIRHAGDRRLLGYLTVMNIHPPFRSAELGVTIGAPEERGKGYGGEAMALAVEYCWRQLDLARLTLKVYGPNPAALACYARLGFEIEGVMREAAYFQGHRMDVTILGLLRK